MEKIINFLEKKNNPDSKVCFITDYSSIESRWKLSLKDQVKFFNLYCSISEEENKISVYENNDSEFSPIIIDINFKFDNTDNFVIPYEKEFIYTIVSCIQETIKFFFNINDTDRTEFLCHYLSYDKPYEDNEYIYLKIRFIFPYFRSNYKFHNNEIKSRFIKNLRNINPMKYLTRQFMGTWDEIVEFYSGGKLLMYGSRDIYKRKLIFREIVQYLDMLNIENDIGNIDLIDIDEYTLDPYIHNVISCNRDYFENNDDTLEIFLPILYSLNYSPNILSPIKIETKIYDNSKIPSPEESKDDKILLNFFLSIISKKKYTIRSYLKEIASAIIKIYKPILGYKLFKEYVLKYNEKEKSKKYNKPFFLKQKEKHYTIKTIAWYALKDSRVKYDLWHKEYYMDAIKRSISSCTPFNVAEAFTRKYFLYLLSTGEGKSYVWYYYDKHKWNRSFKNNKIINYITDDLKLVYDNMLYYLKNLSEKNDTDTKDANNDCIKKIESLINKLCQPTFISNVEKLLRSSKKFFIKDLDDLFHSNIKLTTFKNGITQVNSEGITFRKGKPEDYMNLSSPYEIDLTLSYDDPNVKALLSWFHKLFDNDTFDWIMRYFASLYRGRNLEKLCTAVNGIGNNSKSDLVRLVFSSWGEFAVKISSSYLTQNKINSANANPDILRMVNKRIVVFQEVEAHKTFISSVVKEITGNDSIAGRGLFSNDIKDREMHAKAMIIANKVSKFDIPEKAIYNRFISLKIDAIFDKDAPEDKETQIKKKIYPINVNFSNKTRKMCKAFLWLSYTYYGKYIKYGLNDFSSHIIKHTNLYWKLNDPYTKYIEERITMVDDENVYLKFNKLFHDFSDWYQVNFPKKSIPDSSFVRYELENRWGDLVSNKWQFKKLKKHKKHYDNFEKE